MVTTDLHNALRLGWLWHISSYFSSSKNSDPQSPPSSLRVSLTLRLLHVPQSDREKSEGLPVAPFMDRDKVTKATAQIGFIKFVLIPMFETVTKVSDHPHALGDTTGTGNTGGHSRVHTCTHGAHTLTYSPTRSHTRPHTHTHACM